MKLKETRLLRQVGTNHIYVWAEVLASRADMVEYVRELQPETKPEPEPKPESQETKPFEIKKASKKE